MRAAAALQGHGRRKSLTGGGVGEGHSEWLTIRGILFPCSIPSVLKWDWNSVLLLCPYEYSLSIHRLSKCKDQEIYGFQIGMSFEAYN